MLITEANFIGEITLANLSQSYVREALDLFITKREPEYLDRALGVDFSELFAEGLAAGTVLAKWSELKLGTTYTDADGKVKRWPGLAPASLLSPVANYTYYWYMRDNDTFTAGMGEMEGSSDNAKKTDPSLKMFRAWNEMVNITELLHDFLLNKKDEAGDLVYIDFDIDQVEVFDRINPYGI